MSPIRLTISVFFAYNSLKRKKTFYQPCVVTIWTRSVRPLKPKQRKNNNVSEKSKCEVTMNKNQLLSIENKIFLIFTILNQ